MSFTYREPLVKEGEIVEVGYLKRAHPFSAAKYLGKVMYMFHMETNGEHSWFCHVSNHFAYGGELELTIRDNELTQYSPTKNINNLTLNTF